jgi:hypothetical protein
MSEPLPAPAFNLVYNTPLSDLGSGYAAGITSAGKSVAAAIGSLSDIAKQNVDTNDTLTAMKQGGMLKPEEYESVMGKSLGAKQQMVGLYAGQYIADQAERRAAALQTGKGVVDVHTEHAKLLDMINAVKSGYGTAAGVNTGKLPINPQQNQQVQTAPAVQRALPNLAGTTQNPTPLGSGDIYNPVAATPAAVPPPTTKLTIGPPLSGKEPVPPGGKVGALRGQNGVLMPDGTFRPFQ